MKKLHVGFHVDEVLYSWTEAFLRTGGWSLKAMPSPSAHDFQTE